jgi:hypothetical protein
VQQAPALALPARFTKEIHLAQLTHVGIATREWCDASPTCDLAVAQEDEKRRARSRVGDAQVIDFRVAECETWPGRAELGHHGANDASHRRVVCGGDRSKDECRGGAQAAPSLAPRTLASPPVRAIVVPQQQCADRGLC